MNARSMSTGRMRFERGFLVWVAVILFILAAIFLFFVNAIPTDVDLGLMAVGLAAWAAS